MSNFEDGLSTFVYAFVEERKLTNTLIEFRILPLSNSKWTITLVFSSAMIADAWVMVLFEALREYVDLYTQGLLDFKLTKFDRSHSPISSSLVSALEQSFWEAYSQAKSVPSEGFYNMFSLVIRAVKVGSL